MTNAEIDETDVETSDRHLTVERTFDASPGRVFSAFTDPDELEEWYAPGPMTTEVHEFDARPQGTFSISMRGGEAPHDVEGTFVEVVENERLVHTWRGPAGGETRVTVAFEAVDDGTRVVLTHEEFESREAVQRHLEGWVGIYEKLANYL